MHDREATVYVGLRRVLGESRVKSTIIVGC